MRFKIARAMNFAGILIMIVLIVICIPFTIPKLFGLQLYGVETGSMEPVYPVGSVVYVKEAAPEDVNVGDAITFLLGTDTTLVMTHRVMEIDEEAQTFVTKGDANEVEDADPVTFSRLIGKPVFCIPKIAVISDFINSQYGVQGIAGAFIFVLAVWLVADKLKKGEKSAQAGL